MTFEKLWQQADFADAASGGVDSIPPEEYKDYVDAYLMALGFFRWNERSIWWCMGGYTGEV